MTLTRAPVVIDGWGIPTEQSPKDGDAIAAAETPVMDGFAASGSNTAQGYTELEASSLAVGLPEGLMGNSEVGHLNIGAGRVVWQDVSINLLPLSVPNLFSCLAPTSICMQLTFSPEYWLLRWFESTRPSARVNSTPSGTLRAPLTGPRLATVVYTC